MGNTEKMNESKDVKADKGIVFSTKLSQKDLFDFKIYHNYHSVSGIASLLFGLIALFICIFTVGKVNASYTLMMGFFGLFFTIYTPVGMYLKSKKHMKKDALKNDLLYEVYDDKIILKQGEISETLLWDDIFKIKFTGKNIILYITSLRANIIPLEDIGDQTEAFLNMAEKKLKPFQIKLNKKKVIEAVGK